MSFVYLASPYTGTPKEKRERHELVVECMAQMLLEGHTVYCPVAMTHIAAFVHNLPESFDFWKKQSLMMLACASELWVAKIDGWGRSKGVETEMILAKHIGIPIVMLEKKDGKWRKEESLGQSKVFSR